MEEKTIFSVSPHIRDNASIEKIMWGVVLALLPSLCASVIYFGWRCLIITLLSVFAAVIAEFAVQKFRKVPISIMDGSAVVTGMLVAFNVPPGVPFWLPIIGSLFAIIIVKQAFGGLGFNPINPALAGRAFLMASWPVLMTTTWIIPEAGELMGELKNIDVISTATPLTLLKESPESGVVLSVSFKDLFYGKSGGCIGETSVLAILLGAVFMLFKRYINFCIPIFYISTVVFLTWIFNGTGSFFNYQAIRIPIFHVLTGGLMLGAFFMATDMVTSPITLNGKIIFGIGCGIITVLIRLIGGYPEGVSYSILLMNLTVPLIDKYINPQKFGVKA